MGEELKLTLTFGDEMITLIIALIFLTIKCALKVGSILLRVKREKRQKNAEKKTFVVSATMLPKGQITIPKDVREALDLSNGDKVYFVVDGDRATIINPALYVVGLFRKEAKKGSKHTNSSEDVVLEMIEDSADRF